MSDILTQIQDELDMLLHQMQSSFAYIRTRAPPSPIPAQPTLTSFAEHEASNANQPLQPESRPATKDELRTDIAELSRDLVLKEQQIEVLIAALPGLKSSEEEQVERMRGLEKELEELEAERRGLGREREGLVGRVEERIVRAGRVVQGGDGNGEGK